jgi:ADP-dependent NAD(P)H-hydrate dehydratase / NAD(P)H-hydrate epimerase
VLPVLTAAEAQALDRETESRGIPVAELMERAGRAVARAAVALAGGAYGRRAVVVCGKGNNGGDGLVAAWYLAGWGMGATAVLVEGAEGLRGPAAEKLGRLERAPGARWRPYSADVLARELDRADVVVDAVFGIGFRGVAEGPHADAIRSVNERAVPVVAVDIPSGVEGDTGAIRGPAIDADVTVVPGARKLGHVLFPGAAHVGILDVVDVGFPPELVRGEALAVEAADVAGLLPIRPLDTHKRASGVVLVVAGSRRMTGAPVLVARGAYGMGAGLVTLAVPEGILPVVQMGIAEATFLALPGGPEGALADHAWEAVADRLEGFDAVAVGPGLSTDDGASTFVRRLVAGSPVPLVIDADGINAFAGRPGDLAGRSAPAVITPHVGEFARLFEMPGNDVLDDRVGFVRKAAAETGCVVLLKGSRTLIATPQGDLRINTGGTPALATAGTGDVLTGAIAAMAARGLAPVDAATVAAFVHAVAGGRTGDEAAGTVASDVARALPGAIRSIREGA